jgi:hypothetical protein
MSDTSKHEAPKLRCTRDYNIFELNDLNRPLHDDPVLMASMKKHGFMPSQPIQCMRNGSNKLKVVRGHHRLRNAEQLGLPVWYVVDNSNTDIFELEGGRQAWSISDFAIGRSADGDEHCSRLLEFQKAHRLTLGAAASLMGGESAGSYNKIKSIKSGNFRVASDTTHARVVVSITDHCRASGIAFATATAFVTAVSLAVRVPEFDVATFKHRVSIEGGRLTKRSTVADYLDEIDALYNYSAKGKRIPLAFRAKEVAAERRANFGSKPKTA